MCPPSAVRVDDDLAPSQASVTVGTADHKSTREGEEVQGLTYNMPSAIGCHLTQAVAVPDSSASRHTQHFGLELHLCPAAVGCPGLPCGCLAPHV